MEKDGQMVRAYCRVRLPFGRGDEKGDGNDTSGELGSAFPGSLVGESVFRTAI